MEINISKVISKEIDADISILNLELELIDEIKLRNFIARFRKHFLELNPVIKITSVDFVNNKTFISIKTNYKLHNYFKLIKAITNDKSIASFKQSFNFTNLEKIKEDLVRDEIINQKRNFARMFNIKDLSKITIKEINLNYYSLDTALIENKFTKANININFDLDLKMIYEE